MSTPFTEKERKEIIEELRDLHEFITQVIKKHGFRMDNRIIMASTPDKGPSGIMSILNESKPDE